MFYNDNKFSLISSTRCLLRLPVDIRETGAVVFFVYLRTHMLINSTNTKRWSVAF